MITTQIQKIKIMNSIIEKKVTSSRGRGSMSMPSALKGMRANIEVLNESGEAFAFFENRKITSAEEGRAIVTIPREEEYLGKTARVFIYEEMFYCRACMKFKPIVEREKKDKKTIFIQSQEDSRLCVTHKNMLDLNSQNKCFNCGEDLENDIWASCNKCHEKSKAGEFKLNPRLFSMTKGIVSKFLNFDETTYFHYITSYQNLIEDNIELINEVVGNKNSHFAPLLIKEFSKTLEEQKFEEKGKMTKGNKYIENLRNKLNMEEERK